jgi:acyl-CoA thioester hydrolase
MPVIFECHRGVRDDEIDAQGHTNSVCYVAWMQDAALAHSAAQGWPAEAYQRLSMGWVVRSHAIEYHQPALVGDRIVVRTWVSWSAYSG